jgi:integrase
MSKLTTEYVAGVIVDGTDQWHPDSSVPGFGLRVTPQGAMRWVARKRVQGKLHKQTIGEFPALSPSAARKEAVRILTAWGNGKDPDVEKAERQRTIEANTTTVAQLSERWMREVVKLKRKPRTQKDYAQLFAKKINPVIGSISVAALSWEDVNALHGAMAKTPRRANYVVATIRALMNYAEKLKLRSYKSNPTRDVEFFPEKDRERFLSEIEMAKAAEAIATAERDGRIGPHAAAGLRLCLLTGARRGEVTAAEWSHVDWQHRFIRLPDSKNNKPRTVHLSEAAIDVLRSVPRIGKFIIAGTKPDEPFKNLSRSWIVAREYAGLQDVRLHDLRHSFASLAASQKMSLQMIGRLLGHRATASTARYAHLALDAVAAANDVVGAAMTAAIEKGAPQPAGVVKLSRRRKTHASKEA